jgi:hypothetical protein
MIKMSVKDTLINKIKAIPNFDIYHNEIKEIEFKCNCKIDYNNCKFYHKKNCKGILLKGKMNKKEIIVCSLCRSLNFYENYIWMCPICENRTGFNIKNKINLIEKGKNLNNIIEKKHNRDKSVIYNSEQKNYECCEGENIEVAEKKVCKKINVEYGDRKKNNYIIHKIPKPKRRNVSLIDIFLTENKENNMNQANIKMYQNNIVNNNNKQIIINNTLAFKENIKLNICDILCYAKNSKKRKDIELFRLGNSFYKKNMDIVHVFTLLTITEKVLIKDNEKIMIYCT